MLIPYVAFLIVYLVCVAIVLLFSFASLYHLLRFGYLSPVSVGMTFALIAGTILILFISYEYLALIDWTQTWDVWAFISSLNPF